MPRIQNNSKVLKGEPLHYNAGLQKQYARTLELLTRPMTDDVRKSLISLFRQRGAKDYFIAQQAKIVIDGLHHKWTTSFNLVANTVAEQMVNSQLDMSAILLRNSIKSIVPHLSLNTAIVPDSLIPKIEAAVEENVGLIKSIPQQYLQKVQGDVMRSITTGEGLKSLKEDLLKYADQEERRALNIALDQTRKIYNIANAERMLELDLDRGEWLHSGGGLHPRKHHIAMNGMIFSLKDLPVISAPGELPVRKGLPGQEPFCGCTMAPVI